MLYAQQGDVSRATESLRKAIELRPNYPEALNNLGVLFVRTQKYAEAEDQFKTGIQVAPNFDESYLNLARLYACRMRKGRQESAARFAARTTGERKRKTSVGNAAMTAGKAHHGSIEDWRMLPASLQTSVVDRAKDSGFCLLPLFCCLRVWLHDVIGAAGSS